MKSLTLKSRPYNNGVELISGIDMDFESPKKKYNIIVRASSLPDISVGITIKNAFKKFLPKWTRHQAMEAEMALEEDRLVHNWNNSFKL